MNDGPLVRQSTSHRGCSLSWYAMGDGPPIIMIQGMGVGAFGWLRQIEALASQFRCLAFDNRGYGQSQPAAEKLTMDVMADDVLALMDGQGWESAHLVAHSIGGLIALYAARRAPERVRSLSLLCSFASGRVPTRSEWPLLSIGLRTRVGTAAMRRKAFLELVVPRAELTNSPHDELAGTLSFYFGRDLASSPAIIGEQFAATRMADATPFLTELRAIPTLVVSAEHDLIAPPAAGRALADGLHATRYVCLPNAAHGVIVHNPATINALLFVHLIEAETLTPSYAPTLV